MSPQYKIGAAADLNPGERKIVEVDGLPHSVGVFNIDGNYHALANICPHQLAPLCEGTITGKVASDGVGDYKTARDGEIIRCPWHGWKFDITDGTSVFNPHEVRTRAYEVTIESPDGTQSECNSGACLQGDEPPVDSYEVSVDDEMLVLHV